MSAQIFEARSKCLRELRDAGHEELEDFLGGADELGAAVRTGLLVKVHRCCDWQRYQGLIPTERGEEFLLHVPEHHVIVVKHDRKQALHIELLNDPLPGEPLRLDPGALPCGLVPAPPANPTKRTDFDPVTALQQLRQQELECWLIEGYMDFEEFRAENGLVDQKLLASGLFRRRDERIDDHRLPLVPTEKGEHFLLLNGAWDLLLVKPEMGRNLFMLIDPDRARGWMAA
ncbi:MAG: hypothetical protein IPO90_00085 [Flavobacteriales bacterium]|nr:hypothetical protein [Flavobacteriales bacterium]MBL0044695.1 hypothetical protein [Flavobacteriales bacterium]